MSDRDCIPALLNIASDPDRLLEQHVAAQRLLDFDGETFPSDGCAITLSVLLQEAGIAVNDTYQAIVLGNLLKIEKKLARHRDWGTAGRRCRFHVRLPAQSRLRSYLSGFESSQCRRNGDCRQSRAQTALQICQWCRRQNSDQIFSPRTGMM